jgi:anti-sigma factor RsiW
MKCKTVYRFICDNLDERLDSPRCRQIRRHLEGCPDCQSYLKSIKQTVRLYKAAPSPRVPEATHRKLMKVLECEILHTGTPQRRQRRRCH